MHITINRAELLAAVKRASAIAPADSPLDVLRGVLLETDSANGMLTVTSTNLEVSLAEKLPCTVREDGALVFAAKTLGEMLQRLPEETAELCRRENRGRMVLTSGTAGYSVDVWDLGAFPKPDLPFPEDTVKVSGVPSMAQHTVFATAQDKNKPLLRCVNLMFTSTGLRAAGSNGSCIVTAKGDDQSTGDISLLVPASSLGKLAGMCGNEDVFRVGTTGKSIVFFKENFLFSSRLMDGGYIDTDSLLKTITNSFTVLTDIKEMRDALFSAMSVAPDGRVRLSPAARVIATMNYGYAGTRELNEALASRFVVLRLPPLSEAGVVHLLEKACPELSKAGRGVLGKLFSAMEEKHAQGEISSRAVDLRGLLAAVRLMRRGLSPLRALSMGLVDKCMEEDERGIAEDVLQLFVAKEAKPNEFFA